MKNIILFASGNGSNAENICRYFQNHAGIRIAALFCNNAHAGVIPRMAPFHVPVHLFNKAELMNPDVFLPLLDSYKPDLVVLAGFLWLLPEYLIKKYPDRIINIHPALLPRYGGKGMYGHHVHEAVLASGEVEHGITIHYVNEHFDEGRHLLQQKFPVHANDTLDSISSKIAALEMAHFPLVIEKLLS